MTSARGMMKAFNRRIVGSVLGVVAALATASCGGGAAPARGDDGVPSEGSAPEQPTARLDGDVIRDWNRACYLAAVVDGGYFNKLFFDDRAFTMVAIAQHDALNSIEPRYEVYAYQEKHPGGDPIAAAAQAGHDVLAAMYPAQVESFDKRLAASLGEIPDGEAKTAGIAAGRGAAAAIIADRKDDGLDGQVEYKPKKAVYAWQPTPPLKIALAPGLGKVRPFALSSADQFRPAPPPDVSSKEYADAYNEVKEIGAMKSTTRTEEQSDIGRFWYEFSGLGWAKVAGAVTSTKESDLWDTARALALVHMALFDSYVAGFEAKYHYAPKAGWRPYTAIRMAAKDRNSATKPDPKWEPFLSTPPVPDYPSTHSVLGAAAASVLADLYGDETPFEFTSGTFIKGVDPAFGPTKVGAPDGEKRAFKSLSQAARENADSRVFIGIHFRFACDAGLEQGKKIGEWVAANRLKPLKS